MPYSALPEPMLARSGRLPTSKDYSFEVTWDGFRAIVSTEGAGNAGPRGGRRNVHVFVHEPSGSTFGH
jgi:hypothetical protein